jgi:effector-binding domain-containing protein
MDASGEVELRELQPTSAAVVRGHVDLAGIPRFVGAAFGETLAALAQQQVAPSGPPFARYHLAEGGFDIEAGFPAAGPIVTSGRVHPTALPGGQVATVLHRGDYYSAVGAAYDAAMAWIGSHDRHPSGDPWESYLDGPDVPEPRTLVHVPCRAN